MSTINLFAQLRRLLPGPVLQVGTVVSSNATSSVLDLPGGAQVSVRGTAAPGATVFFAAGRIEGPAPALPLVTLEV